MKRRAFECRVCCSPWLYIGLALFLLMLPLRWLMASFIAAVVHEIFHVLAVKAFGVRIYEIEIGILGAKIRTEPMGEWQSLLCALAGPIGAFSLLALSRWIPMISLCAALQSAYNLLPVSCLDGGRALRCIVRMALPKNLADRGVMILETVTIALTIYLGVYGTFGLSMGPFPLLLSICLGLRAWNESDFAGYSRKKLKIPCIAARHRVQ